MRVQDVEIVIRITKPGVYCLGLDGANGKSYLYSMLDAYYQLYIGNDVLAVTYDSRLIDKIADMIREFQGKIIMLDRFDLYCTNEIIDAIIEKRANTIILLDLKSDQIWNKLPVKFAKINIGRDESEVLLC